MGFVDLILRESGHRLHGVQGAVRVNMNDATIFQPINGAPFINFVSDSGSFYPGIHVPIVKDTYTIDGTENTHPNEQLFVLATTFGEFAEPIRVDFDPTTATTTSNAGGRFLLMFLEGSLDTGLFALFNEETGRPVSLDDPIEFFEVQIATPVGYEDFYNTTNDFSTIDGFTSVDEFVDATFSTTTDITLSSTVAGFTLRDVLLDTSIVNVNGFILVSASTILGIDLQRETFVHVFGTEVPNAQYQADDDPYYDDLNSNGVQDVGEPTAPFRPTLFDPYDWRSTDIRLYYRRVDNGASVLIANVDFSAATPQTLDGVALVHRRFRPRLNAFRFGRPNTAINLVSAFASTNFFDGTHALTRETSIDILSAIAIINLVMDQVFNIETQIDIDGIGPLPSETLLIEANIFVAPIKDPFVLLLKGFADRATR